MLRTTHFITYTRNFLIIPQLCGKPNLANISQIFVIPANSRLCQMLNILKVTLIIIRFDILSFSTILIVHFWNILFWIFNHSFSRIFFFLYLFLDHCRTTAFSEFHHPVEVDVMGNVWCFTHGFQDRYSICNVSLDEVIFVAVWTNCRFYNFNWCYILEHKRLFAYKIWCYWTFINLSHNQISISFPGLIFNNTLTILDNVVFCTVNNTTFSVTNIRRFCCQALLKSSSLRKLPLLRIRRRRLLHHTTFWLFISSHNYETQLFLKVIIVNIRLFTHVLSERWASRNIYWKS